MKQPLALLLIIILILCLQSSCKEEFECSSSNTVNIPQIMKDYFYYKEGTWWVYKNIKNNTYDSMWVSQNSSNNYRGEGKEGFGSSDRCYEQTRSVISSFSNSDLMSFRISNIITDEKERFRFIIFWRDPSNGLGKDFNLFFTNGILEMVDPIRPLIVNTLDSINVQNNIFNSLIEVDTRNFYYDNIKYRLFARNIGLIKYIDKDSNQWELIKHSINQ